MKSRVVSVALDRTRVERLDVFPFSIPAIHTLSQLALHPDVTFLVGENGTGKSTLIEAIAEAAGCNPEGGSRNLRFKTRDSHSSLGRYLTLVNQIGVRGMKDAFFLRAESFYNTASALDETEPLARIPYRSYGGRSLHEQSHGESFFATIQNRFGPNGFYMLDEPESALSPKRLLSLLVLINDLVREECQFVIATHSPILMAFPKATIYELGSWGIRSTKYEETEHYQVTKMFLDRYTSMLREMFKPR